MPYLGPIDALSAIALFWGYVKSQDAKGREFQTQLHDKQAAEMEAMKAERLPEGRWTREQEGAMKAFKDAAAAYQFSFWFSTRTFPLMLCGSVVSSLIGFSTVPGCFLGWLLSAPRFYAYLILGAHVLSGGSLQQPKVGEE